MKITAALAVKPGEPLVFEELDMTEKLGPHEVLVRNVASGICHSDMSMRDLPDGVQPLPGVNMMPKPIILGHEGAGIVERVGSEVSNLEPGDHVIMSFHYDGTCPSCQQDLHQYCESFVENNLCGLRVDGSHAVSSDKYDKVYGSYHQQSSFATHSIATDHNAIKVPKDLPLEMLAPLGCGFLTGAGAVIHRLKPEAGSSIAIFGAGPLGFAAMYMARKAGCSTIIAVDLHANRLELAREFGATHLVNASEVDDSVAAIREICPLGTNYCYEATGSTRVMEQAIEALAVRGHGAISGVVLDPTAKVSFSPGPFEAGKTLSGILMGDADLPGTVAQLIEAVRSGDFPIDKLITYYDFEDINQAIEDSETGKSLKCVVRMESR